MFLSFPSNLAFRPPRQLHPPRGAKDQVTNGYTFRGRKSKRQCQHC